MFFCFAEERESLAFKLAGAKDYEALASRGAASKNAEDNLGSWGHEFVRSLAGEIGQEYNQRVISPVKRSSNFIPQSKNLCLKTFLVKEKMWYS